MIKKKPAAKRARPAAKPITTPARPAKGVKGKSTKQLKERIERRTAKGKPAAKAKAELKSRKSAPKSPSSKGPTPTPYTGSRPDKPSPMKGGAKRVGKSGGRNSPTPYTGSRPDSGGKVYASGSKKKVAKKAGLAKRVVRPTKKK